MSYRYGIAAGNRPGIDHSYRPLRARSQWDARLRKNYELAGFDPDAVADDLYENKFRLAFPLALPLSAYFKLCWRVKKFTLSGNITTSGDSRDFETEISMVRLPVEGDPVVVDDIFQTIAAESEIDIIRASERWFFRDTLAPGLPMMDPVPDPVPEKYSEVPAEWRDSFSGLLRNTGFFARQYDGSTYDFTLAKLFPEGDTASNLAFSLLTDSYPLTGEFVNYPDFTGAIYDEEEKLVYAPFFLAFVLNLHSCQAMREPVPATGDYPPLFFVGDDTARETAGEVSIEGLQDDPIIVPMFRGPGSTAELNATLTALEFWPWLTTDGQPVFDATTGAQLRNPFS